MHKHACVCVYLRKISFACFGHCGMQTGCLAGSKCRKAATKTHPQLPIPSEMKVVCMCVRVCVGGVHAGGVCPACGSSAKSKQSFQYAD